MRSPTDRPTSTGAAARNGSKPGFATGRPAPARPRSRSSHAAGQRQLTISASNISRRGDEAEDRRVVALEIASRPSRDRPGRGQQEGGRAERDEERPDRRQLAWPCRDDRAGDDKSRPRRPGTVMSRPSQSCVASSWPADAPRPRARARLPRRRRTIRTPIRPTAPAATVSGPSAATDKAASLDDRWSRYRSTMPSRPERNWVEPGRSAPVVLFAASSAPEVGGQDVDRAGVEVAGVDEEPPAVPHRQPERQRGRVGVRARRARSRTRSVRRPCRRSRRRPGHGRRTSRARPGRGRRTGRRPATSTAVDGRGNRFRSNESSGSTFAARRSPTSTPIVASGRLGKRDLEARWGGRSASGSGATAGRASDRRSARCGPRRRPAGAA